MREVWLVLNSPQENNDKTYFPSLPNNMQICEAGPDGAPIEHVQSFVQSMTAGFSKFPGKPTITLAFLDGSTEKCAFLGWATPAHCLTAP